MNSQIHFFYGDVTLTFRDRRKIKSFIPKIFYKNKRVLKEISCVFCSDEELLVINKRFLNHDYYTDVITFDLSFDQKEISGEIYISVDRVKENAKTFKNSFKDELIRVLFHGVLHLCGFNDKNPVEKKVIKEREDFFLKQYKKYVSRET